MVSAVLILAISTSSAMSAPVVILVSTIDGLTPGSVIEGDTLVDIPAGGMIILNDETGATRTLSGPYSGALKETVASGNATDTGVVTSLSRLLTSREEAQTKLGAVRALPSQMVDDANLISIARSGSQCGSVGAAISLWRPETLNADSRIAITNISTNRHVEMLWQGGQSVIAWPDDLPAMDGARYLVKLEISPRPVEIELHLVPDTLVSVTQRAAWMSDAGCHRQALQLLAELTE